jgi:GDPmannose 4,6-dehydratase
MRQKTAVITGVTGQDGSLLAELLLAKDYIVHGIVRRASTFNTGRLEAIYSDPHESGTRMFLHYGDVTDGSGLRRLLEEVQPDEIYNLAAQSHVRVSFDQPEYTADTVALGTLRILEALRSVVSAGGSIRFYQAGSSEMYGAAPPPQNESTMFHPRSPYAVSKVAAHWFAANYREAYDLFVCNGILFNHESERRGETFVTRKITRALTRIKLGLQRKLYLGNLDARRDWGYAGDYVEAMWLMLQADEPSDYVIATGETHSVREFLDAVAEELNMEWHPYVHIDPRYFRPTDVDCLLGDFSKARRVLGWEPRRTFRELVRTMVRHDLRLAEQERLLIDNGHAVTTSEHLHA